MNTKKNIFSSESVTEGHPDKVCDQISDAILDEYIKKDPLCRVACETMIMPGKVIIAAEISSSASVDILDIIKNTLKNVSYTEQYHGLSPENCEIELNIVPQSEDISLGVDNSLEPKEHTMELCLGAGDQGIMHGYATRESENLMPLPITLSHMLVKKLDQTRKQSKLDYLLSDGKAQVSMEYSKDNFPVRCDTIVLSAQHLPDVMMPQLQKDLLEHNSLETIPEKYIDKKTRILINPTGRFVSGGAKADCGLTGRKLIVDTYGGWARHGGGAFSGKDPSKVDRSGAYMARYIAKNIIASGICDKIDVQLAYAIGVAHPVGVYIDTFGTGKIPDSQISSKIQDQLDLTPSGMIQKLNLLNPIYKQLAVYGHVGRVDIDLPWEQIDYLYLGM